jgi:catechol 2,3-dioxygenase-like lactoylglutathione lyase family enzyme
MGVPHQKTQSVVLLDHASLAVSDLNEAIGFFSAGFGFITHFVEWGMTSQIASMLGLADAVCDIAQLNIGNGGTRLELIAFRQSQVDRPTSHPTSPGMGHICLRVTAFEGTLLRLKELGARQLGSITQFEEGRAVYLGTPFGAFIEVQEWSPESSENGEAQHA